MKLGFDRIVRLITRVFHMAFQHFMFGQALFSAAMLPLVVTLLYRDTPDLTSAGVHPLGMVSLAAREDEFIALVFVLTLMVGLWIWLVIFAGMILRWQGRDDGVGACISLVARSYDRLLGVLLILVFVAGPVVAGGPFVAGAALVAVIALAAEWQAPVLSALIYFLPLLSVTWFLVRILPVCAVVLAEEERGPVSCLSRAYSLTKGSGLWLFVSVAVISITMALLGVVTEYLSKLTEFGTALLYLDLVIFQLVLIALLSATYMTLVEGNRQQASSQ